jgi:nicotinamide riboside kinase
MKIAISGAQSVGKTTLLNALRSEEALKDYKFCFEVTRRVKGYGLSINEDGDDTTQRLIMQEHIVNAFMYDNMIADRCALDGLVYSHYLAENKKITEKTYQFAESVFHKLMPEYDLVFYIPPEFPIEDDGIRSINTFFRDRIVTLFDMYIKDKQINTVYLTGSVRERVNTVLNHVKDYNNE